MNVEDPEDFTNLKEYDSFNEGDLLYSTLSLKNKDQGILAEDLNVKAKTVAKLYFLTQS